MTSVIGVGEAPPAGGSGESEPTDVATEKLERTMTPAEIVAQLERYRDMRREGQELPAGTEFHEEEMNGSSSRGRIEFIACQRDGGDYMLVHFVENADSARLRVIQTLPDDNNHSEEHLYCKVGKGAWEETTAPVHTVGTTCQRAIGGTAIGTASPETL